MTNACNRCCYFFRGVTFFACVAFSNVLLAVPSSNYCEVETGVKHFDLSRGTVQKATLDQGAELGFTREALKMGAVLDESASQLIKADFNFQYTIFDFDNSIVTMTNGHLHTWDFPVSVQRKGADYEFRYYLAPVISVSSNIMKNSDLLDREGVQLWAGFVYKKEQSPEGEWLVGFRSDHRFGPYHAYPVFGYCWKPDANWQLQLALPDFNVRRLFTKGISVKLYAEPDGNKWHVFSKDKTRDSDFFYDAIVTGVSFEWRAGTNIRLELDVVKHIRRRLSFVLDDNTLIKTGVKPGTGLTVSAGVLF